MIAIAILWIISGFLLTLSFACLLPSKNAYGNNEYDTPSERFITFMVTIIVVAFSVWCTVNIRQSIIDRSIEAYLSDEVSIIEKTNNGVITDTTYRLQKWAF